jgi:hypothetical protein
MPDAMNVTTFLKKYENITFAYVPGIRLNELSKGNCEVKRRRLVNISMFSYTKYIYKLLHKIYLQVTTSHSTAVATFTEAVLYGLIYRYKYNTYQYRTKLKSDLSLNCISTAPCRRMGVQNVDLRTFLAQHQTELIGQFRGPANFT